MTGETETRLTALEREISHQTRLAEELSDEVRRQGETIDRLEKALRILAGRLLDIEENGTARPEITKPPHY